MRRACPPQKIETVVKAQTIRELDVHDYSFVRIALVRKLLITSIPFDLSDACKTSGRMQILELYFLP